MSAVFQYNLKRCVLLHIGNCLKADPAYGKGVADALGIPLSEVEKNRNDKKLELAPRRGERFFLFFSASQRLTGR